MKTFLLVVTLVLLTAFAGAQTTPNLNLNIPVPGSHINSWGPLMVDNFTKLDFILGSGGNGILKRTSNSTWGTAVSQDVIALFSGSCDATTYLRGDGACAASSGNTYSAGLAVIGDTASSTFNSKGEVYADAPQYADGSGDDCATLRNAQLTAYVLGQTVNAKGLTGERRCASDPIYDLYTGAILFGPSRWWIVSNVATLTIPSRLDLIGVGVGRPAGGANSGTIFELCNGEANPQCNSAVYDPLASNRCVDGGGTPFSCPMVCWSRSTERCLPTSLSFDSRLIGIDWAGNRINNAVGVRNGISPQSVGCTGKCGGQENTGVFFSRFDDFTTGNARALVTDLGSQNSNYSNLEFDNNDTVHPTADCTNAVSIDSLVPSATNGNGPKGFSIITNTNLGCVINPQNAILLDSSNTVVDQSHFENIFSDSILVGSRADVKGFMIRNANGAPAGGSVVKLAAGNILAGTIENVLNINASGYTINDLYHGFGIRVDCENLTSLYSFGWGASDSINTPSGCIPKALITSHWGTTDVDMFAGAAVKIAAGIDNIVTQNLTTDQDRVIGFAMQAITTSTTQAVPVAVSGIIGAYPGVPGPIVETGASCTHGDIVYGGVTDKAKVRCSTTPLPNVEPLGTAIKSAAAAAHLEMLVQIRGPRQLYDSCSSTGVAPAPCAAHSSGIIALPHSCSGGTCVVNTTAVDLATDTLVLVTPTNQLGVAAGQCEANATATVASAASIVAGIVSNTSFAVHVPTLNTALSQYCINYQIFRIQ